MENSESYLEGLIVSNNVTEPPPLEADQLIESDSFVDPLAGVTNSVTNHHEEVEKMRKITSP
jgi:hypothetical protein